MNYELRYLVHETNSHSESIILFTLDIFKLHISVSKKLIIRVICAFATGQLRHLMNYSLEESESR